MGFNGTARSLIGYHGLATIVCGSWRIAGRASFNPTTRIGFEEELGASCAGTFVATSDTEPLLLSALAAALHQSYGLRLGEEADREEPIGIEIIGHEGNRIRFALRG